MVHCPVHNRDFRRKQGADRGDRRRVGCRCPVLGQLLDTEQGGDEQVDRVCQGQGVEGDRDGQRLGFCHVVILYSLPGGL